MLTTPGLTQAERPAGFKGESDVNFGNVLKDDTAPLRTAYILLPLHFYGRAASWFSFIKKARKMRSSPVVEVEHWMFSQC